MEKIYWHHHEFRHELRGVAAHYPKTYIKVGKILKEKGLLDYHYDYKNQTNDDLLKEWIAILQYMPKHVIPYRGMGTDKPWCEHDWTRRTKELAQ